MKRLCPFCGKGLTEIREYVFACENCKSDTDFTEEYNLTVNTTEDGWPLYRSRNNQRVIEIK